MLRVSLLGNMGADPEVRYSPKGSQIVSFSVAVNQVRTGPGGERQENTEWFRVKVAGRQSEFVQRLSKGTRVVVIGRLDIGHYMSKEGEPRTSFDVWADEVQAMSPSRVPSGGEAFAADAEGETPEPVGAGVSSLGGGSPGRAATNGKNSRAAARSEPAAAREGASGEDLEDLPF